MSDAPDIREYEPTLKQQLFHKSRERFKLYGGAMGGGKSVALCAEVIWLACKWPKNHILLARKSLRDLKKTTLETFFDMLPTDLIKNYNKTDGVVRIKNDSIILFSDLENTDKLKSLNLGAFGIDEASETSDDIFKMLASRLRRNIPGIKYYGVLASNPEPGWLKDRFVDPQMSNSAKADHLFIQSLPKENPHLPEGYVEQLALDFPPLWITKYLEGSWDVFDSQIFQPDWIRPGIADEYAVKYTAIDPAISEKDEADETVICTIGIGYDNNIYEVESISGRWSFDKIIENCKSVYERHKPDIFGVESVAFQKALYDVLMTLNIPCRELKADRDKVRRAIGVTDLLEQGRVFVNSPQLQKQMLEFPKGTHDDYVDAFVYCLRMAKDFSSDNYIKKNDIYAHLDGSSRRFWEDQRKYMDAIDKPGDITSLLKF